MPYELVDDQPNEENQFLTGAKEVGRHVGRQASNLSSLGVGFTGDILSLVNDFIARPAYEKISGEKGSEYEETPLGKLIPTTDTHKKNLQSQFGETLKPQNKVEQWADDILEDTASLMSPSGVVKSGIKIGSKIFKNLAKSVGANLVGESVKQNTQNENSGTWAKAGSLFFLSLFDQEAAAKQVSKLYNKADSNLPKTAKENASGFTRKIDSLENSITKGRPLSNLSAPEKFVVDQVDKMRNLIQNGEISIEQAIAQKRSLHKDLSTLYKDVPKHSDQKTVKNLAKQLSNNLNEVISIYGKKNPKFFKPYKDADQAFGTLAKSDFISHWIEGHVVQHPLTTGLLHVLAPTANVVSSALVPVSGLAAKAVLPYQIAKLTYRIGKSPTLAKIYGNTVKAAAKENSVAFTKYLKQLDKELQKDESNDRYEFVD